MRRRASVTWAAARTWRTPGPAAAIELLLGVAEAVDDLGLATVEQRREHAVGDDRRRLDAGVVGKAPDEVDRLGHRHLLGRRHDDQPVTSGSSRMSVIHAVWSRTIPTLTSSRITRGAPIWATMWPLASASTTTRS